MAFTAADVVVVDPTQDNPGELIEQSCGLLQEVKEHQVKHWFNLELNYNCSSTSLCICY